MPTVSLRRPLCLLLLAAAPFAGLWLGEGMVPLISPPAVVALLVIAFGAALAAPSPRPRGRYYVLAAATVMFLGSWAAGHALVKRAYQECHARGQEVRAALEHYRAEHGGYPARLEQLGIALPGQRRLHDDLLHYQPQQDDYRLFYVLDRLRFIASRHTPFAVHRLED